MQKLEEIHDPEALQQAALLLEKTVIRQNKEIATLRAENARLRGQDVDPQMELTLLREQLAAMQQKLYGRSSEKRSQPKDGSREKSPRTGHGPRPQPDLPIEEVTHTLPEDERSCSFCGGQLGEMADQTEDSEEITVVEISYKLVRHRRQKYRCRCNAQVVTAPGPEKLIPGGRYSVELAVHVAESKYLDHLPLERQVRAMARRGLVVDSQTLWDQLEALDRYLRPTYEALVARALENDVVLVDETHWKLAEKKNQTSKWWVWCVVSDHIATYRVLGRRSVKEARRVLDGYSGVVMTDGYSAYETLAKELPGLTPAHCWAHVRRKFLEGEDAYPETSKEFIDLIGKLFMIEQLVPRAGPGTAGEDRAAALEDRRKLRDEQSRPIVNALMELALERRPQVLPESKMGKAIKYMLKLWPGLKLFLDDPRVPLDNNGAERALRGVVVGRKNHYGSRSKRGTEVAALLYTLFETAKLSEVDPRTYVLQAAQRAIRSPGTVTLPNDI